MANDAGSGEGADDDVSHAAAPFLQSIRNKEEAPQTGLIEAARAGDLSRLQKLVSASAVDSNELLKARDGEDGSSLVHLAIRACDAAMLRWLISVGAPVEEHLHA